MNAQQSVAAIGEAHARPGMAGSLEAVLTQLVHRARTEPGFVTNSLTADQSNSSCFIFYEEWASDEDLAEHLRRPYMQEFLATKMDYLERDLELRMLRPLAKHETHSDTGPAEMNHHYISAYNNRDIDALMATYEPGASSVWQPGSSVRAAEHRDTVVEFFAKEPHLQAEISDEYVSGNIAALVVDWRLTVTGAPEMNGTGRGFDVLRRSPDGNWRYVITNPFGSR